MHIFPQLRKMEQKYAGELAVVGVHSAKFMAEKATDSVRQAILRYDIAHPVVNDQDFIIWQRYAARAWPTLFFIDPEGKLIGRQEGEIPLETFDQLLNDMIQEFDEKGLIDRRPLKFKLEQEKEWERPLSFPGKVLGDAASRRLFIADSNHQRIVVSSLDGDVQHVVGSGDKGLTDGGFDEARFNDPQGLAIAGDFLFVADTKNHAIRAIDLANKNVKTIAGTGEQAQKSHGGGVGASTPLKSPWDLALHDGSLYIAMAGLHQLWRLDLDTHEVRPHAGTGRENIEDGPLAHAQLAQPSGMATDGQKLYFTDSETSAVRTADINTDGRVSTIVGVGLFDFGDVDGVGAQVRMQHPLGIDILDDVLFIADTYNNKIKRIFPITQTAATFLGDGETGDRDGPATQARFREPGGISIAGDRLFIADTNNHAIRVADLQTGEVDTLTLKGV